jgi:cell division protein FtsW (lipid II flippase)
VIKTLPDAHTDFVFAIKGNAAFLALTLVLVTLLAFVLVRWRKGG